MVVQEVAGVLREVVPPRDKPRAAVRHDNISERVSDEEEPLALHTETQGQKAHVVSACIRKTQSPKESDRAPSISTTYDLLCALPVFQAVWSDSMRFR